jgi:hypothetical protein
MTFNTPTGPTTQTVAPGQCLLMMAQASSTAPNANVVFVIISLN